MFDRRDCGRETVEGQSACRPVQINCDSVRVRGRGCRYVCCCVIVPGTVTLVRAEQTPGLIIPSKTAGITVSSPLDSSVCHSDINPSSPPYLPVTASIQTITAQELFPLIKSLWMIRIWLLLFSHHHCFVVFRQNEISVGCVWVQ